MQRSVIAFLVLLTAGPAAGDVIDRSPNGFTIKGRAQVAAAPDAAFRALVDVAAWWDKAHTYTGASSNLSIVPQPGGCFCEKLPGGGGVEHGRVVHVAPGSLLRLQGALGPLQELGVSGSLSWQVTKAASGSTITMTYAVGGYAPTLEKLAPLVDQVMMRQLSLLKAHLDRDSR
jgi:uncharacterized protein YndB with AHSA1/START domain